MPDGELILRGRLLKNSLALGPKKPRLKTLSLVILECDANKVKAQSLAVADDLNAVGGLKNSNQNKWCL